MFIYEYELLHFICTVEMICVDLWYCMGEGILYIMLYIHAYTLFQPDSRIHVTYRIAGNIRGFRGLPNIRENFIREVGVLAVLSRDSGQHPRKFYLRIFIFGAIRENFVPRIFPAIRYCCLNA